MPPDAGVVAFVRAALPPPPARVLEVGASRGELAAALRAAGYDVVAIDQAADGAPGVEPVALADLDADEAEFAAAVAGVSLRHVEPLVASCERLAEVVRPGGRLVVDEFDVDRFDERAAKWQAAQGGAGGPHIHSDPGHRAAPRPGGAPRAPASARRHPRRPEPRLLVRRAGPRRLPVPLGPRPGPAGGRGAPRRRRRPAGDRRAARRDTPVAPFTAARASAGRGPPRARPRARRRRGGRGAGRPRRAGRRPRAARPRSPRTP